MTKLHEETLRGSVAECLEVLRQRESTESRIKGEFTVVFGPDGSSGKTDLWTAFGGGGVARGGGGVARGDVVETTTQVVTRLLLELRKDGISRSEAVKLITTLTEQPKSTVYGIALSIAQW